MSVFSLVAVDGWENELGRAPLDYRLEDNHLIIGGRKVAFPRSSYDLHVAEFRLLLEETLIARWPHVLTVEADGLLAMTFPDGYALKLGPLIK